MPDPQFTSQTKTQLASDYVQGAANSVTYNAILAAFRDNPSLGRAVVQQSQAAAQARQAEAKRADQEEDADHDMDLVAVTASPYEAQDFCDTGEEIVEPVAIPAGLVAWMRDFVDRHHVEEEFHKRRRDRLRVDRVQDGIGDPRIRQTADVYRSPTGRRRLN